MEESITRWAERKLAQTVQKVKIELERLDGKTPYIAYDGHYTDVIAERGRDWWTNGFWGGILWQLFHYCGDERFKKEAIHQEERLAKALYEFRDIHHDVGFLWLHTAIAHYRETGDKQAYRTGLHAANLLAGRFNVDGNFLVSWNDKSGWVIIDSMMNILLLCWAYEETSDPRFIKIAKRHADTVVNYLVRDDGSVGHIASFNPETGEFIEQLGGQGYSADSAWSRGAAWAIYGFSLMYHHTKDVHYLAIAKRLANYFIANVAATNYIPKVDFKAPDTPEIYDTSAGLCTVCGLLEIAKWLPDIEKQHYVQSAVKMLQAIEETYSNWQMNEDGIIGGGTEAYHRPATYHVPLIYADYFFVEGLLRLVNKELFIW